MHWQVRSMNNGNIGHVIGDSVCTCALESNTAPRDYSAYWLITILTLLLGYIYQVWQVYLYITVVINVKLIFLLTFLLITLKVVVYSLIVLK